MSLRLQQFLYSLLCLTIAGMASSRAATFTVTNAADSGVGTLRWAVTNANITPGTNTIAFGLTGTAPFTITLSSALPTFTNSVIIDGTTQAGYADHPVVVVKGNNLSATNGLDIIAGNSVVRGLAIGGFFDGIRLETNGNNVIQGNYLGTDAYGTNAAANAEGGITLIDCDNNMVGGMAASERNVIAANSVGIWIVSGSTNNTVLNNLVGLKSNGTNALGNGSGVALQAVIGNLVVSNIISGNTNHGVDINSGSSGNRVQGNFIGVDITGRMAVANRRNGVAIDTGLTNIVGGTTAASRNVIAGNSFHGIQLTGTTSSNTIAGNFIGVDVTGTNAVANGLNGILLQSTSGNMIGGASAGARNVISGNGNNGVYLYTSATKNFVQGNYMGTDVTGTHKLPNVDQGIQIEAASNTIGGVIGSSGNLISGNSGNGITLSGASATGNTIVGNFVGTDVNGTSPLANAYSGLGIVNAPSNIIGSTSASARNILSGNAYLMSNAGSGVAISGGPSVGNQIIGNYIGADVSGTASVPNYSGIQIFGSASNNIVGGTATGAGNLLSGNSTAGIYLSGANGTIIQGNFIGTKVDGTNSLGNVYHSVEITNCSFTNIGGTNSGAGNRIAFSQTSGYSGVRIRSGSGNGNSTNNLISGNLIFSNAGLGIDLGVSGVTANVGCNTGTAANANRGQNYPVLSQAVSDAASVGIKGTLNSTANTPCRVQFFANPACASAGNGQGQIFLGEGTVTTDGSCNASFTATINQPVTPGYVVTATATDPNNNTSEFSACTTVSAAPSLALKTSGAAPNAQLVASWPNSPAGFVLKQTTNLAPPVVWTTATNAVVANGATNSATISVGAGAQFFRLSFE